MTPGYLEGLCAHLLTEAGHPAIADVGTYAEAGVTGAAWTPHGLKVTTTDGRTAYLTIVRGSSPTGDPTTMPTVVTPV